jgi:hypothetical protein
MLLQPTSDRPMQVVVVRGQATSVSGHDPAEAIAQALAFDVVAIKIVDFDQRGDGALVTLQDKLKIAPPALPLGTVGDHLHEVGIVKWETTLPACELVWRDHWDDVMHRSNPAFEIQRRRCWWADAC